MGVTVSLVWDTPSKPDGEDFESVFKWSSYPNGLDDGLYEKHPELKKFGDNYDWKILKDFEKLLENIAFFVKYVTLPEWEKYSPYCSPKQILEYIKNDLRTIRIAYQHAKYLEIDGQKPRLSIR